MSTRVPWLVPADAVQTVTLTPSNMVWARHQAEENRVDLQVFCEDLLNAYCDLLRAVRAHPQVGRRPSRCWEPPWCTLSRRMTHERTE